MDDEPHSFLSVNPSVFLFSSLKTVANKGFFQSHALRVPRGSFGEDPGNLEKSRFPGFFIVFLLCF